MIFISIEDFYEKAAACRTMTREEEMECAMRMQNGDKEAREQMIQSYIPMVASHIKHAKPDIQQLGLVIYCMRALEKAVDFFNFLQDSETFAHRLNWYLRQATMDYRLKDSGLYPW